MKDRTPSTQLNIRPLPNYLPMQNTQNGYDSHGNSDDASDVELREYFKVVLKYRLIIIGATVLGAIAAVIFAFLTTPRYSAVSKIRISTYEPILAATKIEDVLQRKSQENSYLDTQIQEISSLSLADLVLNDEDIRKQIFERNKRKGFGIMKFLFGSNVEENIEESVGASYTHPIDELSIYLKLITVEPIRRTSLVNIKAQHEDRALAARIANAHANAYINWVRDTRVKQQSAGLKYLTSQAEELKVKVADLEREISEYAEENSIVAVNKDENITAQRMSQLNRLLTDVTADRMEAENLYKEADSSAKDNSAGFDDVSIQQMRSQLATLEAEYGNLGAKFLPSYPKMQQLGAQIKNLKESIEGQRQQIITGLKSRYQAALEKENSIKEELEQQKSQAFELSRRQVQYNILSRELESNRELLQNVLRQIKETSLAVESNASNVSVVDYAVVPKRPSYPNKLLFFLIGIFLGGGIGLVSAMVISYLDNTIRTPEQIVSLLKVPALGVVPTFEFEKQSAALKVEALDYNAGNTGADAATEETNVDDSKQSSSDSEQDIDNQHDIKTETKTDVTTPAISNGHTKSNVPLVYVNNPKSLASESYRTIRTGILLSQAGEPPRTILVSSAQSSEGKTTSASNLAATLASAGGNVVIIDADLRRPSVYKYFGVERRADGLVEVITGQKTLEEVSVKNAVKRVTVIPSGKIPPNPAELLGSLEMTAILDQLAKQYDYVVIDSPPVLPVTDSVILSRYVDGVVLVVKGASTPRKVVKDAKDRLQAAGARILGVILNDVDINSGDYYYYNRYYYSYYAEEEATTSSGSRAA